ncbi:MAG: hypothetical protein U5R31_00975 [Acidimicrobiia bacterium]|nr:hypothetical protein [Acidimicrobiia bacterium]
MWAFTLRPVRRPHDDRPWRRRGARGARRGRTIARDDIGAFCGTAYGGVATARKVLGVLGLTGGPRRRHGGRLHGGSGGADARHRSDSRRAVRRGAGLRGREDATGDDQVVVLRALGGTGPGSRRHRPTSRSGRSG